MGKLEDIKKLEKNAIEMQKLSEKMLLKMKEFENKISELERNLENSEIDKIYGRLSDCLTESISFLGLYSDNYEKLLKESTNIIDNGFPEFSKFRTCGENFLEDMRKTIQRHREYMIKSNNIYNRYLSTRKKGII